ncbi:MAG: PH domain-containing protein [Bryobacteraceae bacterium]
MPVAWPLLRFDTITIAGNKLRQETGMMSKSTRTLELAKVQDAGRSDLVERLLGLGTIRIETAGDSTPWS